MYFACEIEVIIANDLEQLKTDVCDFIVEIRKENGK